MIASTTFSIDGYTIVETKGIVRGVTVRSPTIKQGICQPVTVTVKIESNVVRLTAAAPETVPRIIGDNPTILLFSQEH